MLCSASNSVSPSNAMRPRRGRSNPAMALITVVLPAPERPKRAVTPSPHSNAVSSLNAPCSCSIATDSVITEHSPARPPHEEFRTQQRGNGKQDRKHTEPQRRHIPARHLCEGVDRERQGLRFSGNIRYERDGRAELAETARERQERAGNDA